MLAGAISICFEYLNGNGNLINILSQMLFISVKFFFCIAKESIKKMTLCVVIEKYINYGKIQQLSKFINAR